MSDETAASDEVPVTFHVKSSGNSKYTLTLPMSTTALDLKNKLATAEYANIPPESQRLIYSGRVLKDADTLAAHKVKEGNTMHLVKSAPSNQRQNPASSTSSTASPAPTSSGGAPSGVPTNIAAGTGNDVLAGLTGARYAGYGPQLPGAGMFGPDGGMGPPPSQEQIMEILSNPQHAQMMSEALRDPQTVDRMIQQSPQLRAMGPQARQLLQSDQFRRMMTNPDAMRNMMQMQRAMGIDPFAGMGGGQNEAFPAPGVTSTTAPGNQDRNTTTSTGQNADTQQNPMAGLFGGPAGAPGGNPFAALFNNPSSSATNSQSAQNPFAGLFNPAMFGQQQQPDQTSGTSSPPPQQQSNPFVNNPLFNNPEMMNNIMQAMGGGGGAGAGAETGAGGANPWANPEMMNNLMQMMGGNGGAGASAGGANPWGNLFGGLGGMGSPPAPADTRPPEERFSEQLRQLNDMGFYDFDRNVQALSRSGGSVQGAIEHLLGGS